MTIWSYVWSIVLGVIVGGLVTGGIMFLVEWWKNKNIANNWLTCLSLVIKENLKKKTAELIFVCSHINSHINIKYLGPVVDECYISSFKCNFGTFKSFLNNGIQLKDYELFLKYLDFVLFEETDIVMKESYMKQYKELNDEVSRHNLRNAKLFEIKKGCETQLKELSEIHKRIQRILPRQMRDLSN